MSRRFPHPHIKTFVDPNLPEVLYLDSSFIVETLVAGMQHQTECMDFIRRLQEKKPIIVASRLTYLEIWCAAIRICIRNLFISKGVKPKDIHIDEILKNYPGLIGRYHKTAIKLQEDFDNLIQRFEIRIISEVTENIINKARDFMLKYNLGSYDATHIATMDDLKIKDIAAFDHSIEDINDVNVWTFGGSGRHQSRWYKRSLLPAI